MSEAKLTLAFDIYGTLVDPNGMEVHLEPFFGSQTKKTSEIWRDKQIEYSFRRALMERYVDFDACTAQALVYVSELLGVALSAADQKALLARYRALPSFPDAASALRELEARGYDLVAFSNGTENAVRNLLEQAGLLDRFRAVISVDDVQSFKPDPVVYAHLVQRVRVPSSSVWLISSNPFDVIGAKSYGLRSAWVRRDQRRIFDPWEFSPDLVVGSLLDLASALDQWLGSSLP
jgi:2-haloacid dehalogenase